MNDSMLNYVIKDNSIIMPFGLCKEVGNISAQKIIDDRNNNGPYTDYIETVRRLINSGIERNVIENLIHAGAFDEFRHSRYTMLSSLDNVIMYANAHRNEISLIGQDDRPIIKEAYDDNMILAENEKNVLGFYFSFNPIIAVKKKYSIDTDNLYNLSISSGNVKGFGLIKNVKQIKTRKGDLMAFVDLIDDKGSLSLAIMPNLYLQYAPKLSKGTYIRFQGKMERQSSCLVKSIELL